MGNAEKFKKGTGDVIWTILKVPKKETRVLRTIRKNLRNGLEEFQGTFLKILRKVLEAYIRQS